jgi:hypothetical protein
MVDPGVEVLVSNDFNSYTTAFEDLELEYLVYRIHYLRWVNRLLKTLQKKLDDEWDEPLDEVRQLLRDLLPDRRAPGLPTPSPGQGPARHLRQACAPFGPPAKTLPPPE